MPTNSNSHSNFRLHFPGLWPFTPDPVPTGLHTFGTPASDAPLLITGNSRHMLRKLEHCLTPMGVRVLAIDVGGVDVHSALATGGFTLQKIEAALTSLADEDQPDPKSRKALLPWAVWDAIGREEIRSVCGWALEPGPADARYLLAFLSRKQELTDTAKAIKFPLEDRLELAAALAAVMTFFLTPLLIFGPVVTAWGLGLTWVIALGIGALWPWLPGGRGFFKGLIFAMVTAVAGLAGSTYLPGFNLLFFAGSLALLGMWTGWLYSPPIRK